MKISRDTLRGYILEEVLAYLIRNTGYRIFVDNAEDPQELGWRGNGLVVKGRGAVHQVDVLGEVLWVPAFTYPLRLFVEAKFRTNPSGIDVVRNIVGTLLDVNQNNLPQLMREEGRNPHLRPKYYYAGAIFSATGFSKPAMDMALAHGVSLNNLDIPELRPLLDAITVTADELVRRFGEGSDIQVAPEAPRHGSSSSLFVLALRSAMRHSLETTAIPPRREVRALKAEIIPFLDSALIAAQNVGELFVGMGQGPYMLVLKAQDRAAFLNYSREHPTHDVGISWTVSRGEGRLWTVFPISDRSAYQLTLRLPEPIADWIFSKNNVLKAALDLKKSHLSNICIYHNEGDRDLLIRLRFKPQQITTAT